MKIEHTPGPWKAVELDENTVAIKLDRNYVHECIHIADAHVMSGNLGEEVPRAIANAKLIAAAPELLETLYDVIHHQIELGGLHMDTYNKVVNAVKKATE